MTSDGDYERVLPKPGTPSLRSQQRFVEMTGFGVWAAGPTNVWVVGSTGTLVHGP